MTPAVTPQPSMGADADANVAAIRQQTVPMLFSDGSKAMVPNEKVLDAIKDGGEVAHHMVFSDGSQAYVPHSKYDGAVADGGRSVNAADQPINYKASHQYNQGEIDEHGDLTTQGKIHTALDVGGIAATMLSAGAASPKVASTAADEAMPSIRNLWNIAKQTEAEAEVTGSRASADGWAKFSDMAARGAADAKDLKAAAGYKTASLLAKANSTYEATWAWIGKTFPGAPIGIKIALAAKIGKEGYDYIMGNDHKDKDEK
jgi:hypothetical protein